MNKPNDPRSKKPVDQAKQQQPPKPAPPPEPVEPPEDSIPLRIVTFLMTVICIGSGCFFVDTPPLMTALYLLFAFGGCYLSYQYRNEQSKWLHLFVTIGMLAVAVNAGHELFTGCGTGRFQLFAPIVHFVAGTFIMHSFEAKTRSDINMSSALGLLLLCLMAPVGKSIVYGACVLAYIMLGAIMLYFDCISRTMQAWLPKPMAMAPLEELHHKKRRRPTGNTVIAIALLPALTVFLFFFIPRFDNIIDVVMANFQKLTNKKPPPQMEMPSGDPNESHRPPRKFEHKNKNKAKDQKEKKELEIDAKEQPEKDIPPKKDKKDKQKQEDKKDAKKEVPKADDKQEKKDDPAAKGAPKSAKERKEENDKQAKSKNPKEKAGPGTDGPHPEKGGSKDRVGDPGSDTDEMPLVVDGDLDMSKLLFTVNCRRTLFFKLTSLDEFDGSTWYHSKKKKKEEPAVFTLSDQGFYHVNEAPSLQPQPDSIPITQDFTVGDTDLSRNIPAASIPKKITNNWKKIEVDSYGTLKADEKIKAQTKYQVESDVPVYDLKALRKEPNIGMKMEDQLRKEMDDCLQIPENQTLEMYETAEKIAKQGNWFNQSERILWYIRKNYKYSLSPPVGGTTNVVETFMSEKSGDCRTFASTFVMMTRAVGIPSRMVAGYAPGEFNKLTGLREVRIKDSHAWAEVYIPRHGWVPFDATPSGTLPDRPKEVAYDFGSFAKKKSGIADGSAFDDLTGEQLSPFQWCMIGLAVIMSIILLVFIVRAIRRMILAWRQRHAHVHPAARILRKLMKDLTYLNIKRSKGDTATDLARKINDALRERSEEGKPVDPGIYTVVDSFMETYSAAHFGNRQSVDELKRQADDIRFRARKKK